MSPASRSRAAWSFSCAAATAACCALRRSAASLRGSGSAGFGFGLDGAAFLRAGVGVNAGAEAANASKLCGSMSPVSRPSTSRARPSSVTAAEPSVETTRSSVASVARLPSTHTRVVAQLFERGLLALPRRVELRAAAAGEQRLLRLLELLARREQRVQILALAPGELVHRPRGNRRLAQLLDLRRLGLAAFLLQRAGKLLALADEVRELGFVQPVETRVEIERHGRIVYSTAGSGSAHGRGHGACSRRRPGTSSEAITATTITMKQIANVIV